MSVTVRLHIFSGNPDPAWELTAAQTDELASRIASITDRTLLKPSGILGQLGYRGFSIHSVRESRLDPEIYVHGGIIDLDRFDVNRQSGSAELESWLLDTAGSRVAPGVRDYVRGELKNPDLLSVAPVESMGSTLAVPPYDPGKWNNDPRIRTQNNCYNYANDLITNTFAQPGRGSGLIGPYPPDCQGTGAAAQRDGEVPVSAAASTPSEGHFIALVIWPYTGPYTGDYHWYRCDSNGKWSHKPGQTAARNTDNSGAEITDPRTCNRGPYTIFCSYFHCIPANVRIG